MRQLTLFLHSSLDSYAEGPNGAMDIEFVAYNKELEQFANKVLSSYESLRYYEAPYSVQHPSTTHPTSHPLYLYLSDIHDQRARAYRPEYVYHKYAQVCTY